MEALFSQPPFRKRRLLTMVALSGLFHVSLVGLAAFWLRPVASAGTFQDTALELNAGSITAAELPPLIAPQDAPPPVAETDPVPPPLQEVPLDDEMAPPATTPDMTEPPAPKKQEKPRSAHAATSSTVNANRGPGAEIPSTGIGRSGAAQSASVPTRLSTPPYPQAARLAHLQGSGSVRITFDSTGRVSSATMVRSVGSGMLDDNTLSYARAFWQGPPNTTATVPITYRLDQ